MNSSVIRIRCQKKGQKEVGMDGWLTKLLVLTTQMAVEPKNIGPTPTSGTLEHPYKVWKWSGCNLLKDFVRAESLPEFSRPVDLTLRLGKDREGLWKTAEIGRRELPGLVANVRLWVPGVHYEVQWMEEIRQRHRKGTDAGTLWHVSVAWSETRPGDWGLAWLGVPFWIDVVNPMP